MTESGLFIFLVILVLFVVVVAVVTVVSAVTSAVAAVAQKSFEDEEQGSDAKGAAMQRAACLAA